MYCITVFFVLTTICAFSAADNAKCSSEINSYHDCQKAYFDNQRANRPDPRKKETDIKMCFTNSGCKEPTLGGGKDGEVTKQNCHKEFKQAVQTIIKSCLKKSLNIMLPDKNDDHDDQNHGPASHNGAHEDMNTLCASHDQRIKAQTCLKNLFNLTKEGKEAGLQKTKNRFSAICDNKRQCLSKVSPECQTLMNKTKVATCDCAKSDLAPKAVSLNQQFLTCTGGTPNANENDRNLRSADNLVHMVCNDFNNEDPCSKPLHMGGENGSRGNENKQN